MLRIFRSVNLAIFVFFVLTALFIVATFIPYDVALVQIYRSVWFFGALGALLLLVVLCVSRKSYFRPAMLPSLALHLSIVLLAVGAAITGYSGTGGVNGVIKIAEGDGQSSFILKHGDKVIGDKDVTFTITYMKNGVVDKTEEVPVENSMPMGHAKVAAPRNPVVSTIIDTVDLGFKVNLKKFSVERYGPREHIRLDTPDGKSVVYTDYGYDKDIPFEITGKDNVAVKYSFKVLGFYPDFNVDMSDQSGKFENPAVRVKISGPQGDEDRVLFANFRDHYKKHGMGGKSLIYKDLDFMYVLGDEDSDISQYRSELEIEDNGQKFPAVAEMNSPFVYKGYRFYQISYKWLGPQKWQTELAVRKDHGYPLVYAAFALFILSSIFIFIRNPFKPARNAGSVDENKEIKQ